MSNPVATQTQIARTKVAIYGGNGFVGTRIAKCLSRQGVNTVALSRTGHKPLHMKDLKWSEDVRWCKGDASEPDLKLLQTIDVLILLVGSPPLPTFSEESYDQQVFMNGTTNVTAIHAAAAAGVKHIILLCARIPWPINTDKFGYAKGKRLSLEAAQTFASDDEQRSATVLKPGAIYGKRYLSSGKVVPLDWFMTPFAKVMPWQFISVDTVAQCVAKLALEYKETKGFRIIENSDI